MDNRFLNNARQGESSFRSFLSGFIIILIFTLVIPGIIFIAFELVSGIGIDDMNQYVVTNIPFIFAVIGVFIVIKYIHKRPIKTIINSSTKINISNFMCGFLVWLFIPLILFLITYLFAPSYYKLTFEVNEFIPIFLIGIVLTFIQVFAEELFFRGYINQAFGIKIKDIYALSIVSGAIFMLAHIANPEIAEGGLITLLLYFWLGFLFSYVVLKYNSLEIAIGMHYANNMFSIFIVSYQNSVMEGTPSIFMDQSDTNILSSLILAIVVGLVNLGMLSVIFRLRKKKEIIE
ncbi:MAG: CPBP family intramembrane metalloprotease [Clostridia bacterium]|nr:CPBP family intramembrane metalloprotease [Clostridia bacterium]